MTYIGYSVTIYPTYDGNEGEQMPRPQKKRFVCCMPKSCSFNPEATDEKEVVYMTVDEYEAIRLIDLEQNTQEACACQMHISRTTVQGIYESARIKLADTIVNGKRLVITGGDYVICKRYGPQCGKGCKNHCHKHQCQLNKTEEN